MNIQRIWIYRLKQELLKEFAGYEACWLLQRWLVRLQAVFRAGFFTKYRMLLDPFGKLWEEPIGLWRDGGIPDFWWISCPSSSLSLPLPSWRLKELYRWHQESVPYQFWVLGICPADCYTHSAPQFGLAEFPLFHHSPSGWILSSFHHFPGAIQSTWS